MAGKWARSAYPTGYVKAIAMPLCSNKGLLIYSGWLGKKGLGRRFAMSRGKGRIVPERKTAWVGIRVVPGACLSGFRLNGTPE
jgi:hypothetical protein